MTNLIFLLAEEQQGGLFDFNATLPLMALQILLLMVVLNLVFYTPVAKVLDERDEYIRKNLTEASETLAKAEAITKKYEQDLAQEDSESQVNKASPQLNTQKEKALLALEEQVNTLSEQIKNKLLSGKLTA